MEDQYSLVYVDHKKSLSCDDIVVLLSIVLPSIRFQD